MGTIFQRLAGFVVVLCLGTGGALGGELNVVHSGQWPPYSDTSLRGQGLAVEIVTTALKRAGYTTVVRVDSLERILEGGALGVYDVFATPWYSDSRNRYLHFSQPYLQSRIRFIKRKATDFDYRSLQDLNGVVIGTVRDYAYGSDFSSAPGVVRVPAGTLMENLQKLIQERIDLTLDDERVLRYQIQRFMPNSMEQLEFLQKPLAVRGIHIGVSRKNAEHARIVAGFDRAIEQMHQDGSFAAIVARHEDDQRSPASP